MFTTHIHAMFTSHTRYFIRRCFYIIDITSQVSRRIAKITERFTTLSMGAIGWTGTGRLSMESVITRENQSRHLRIINVKKDIPPSAKSRLHEAKVLRLSSNLHPTCCRKLRKFCEETPRHCWYPFYRFSITDIAPRCNQCFAKQQQWKYIRMREQYMI